VARDNSSLWADWVAREIGGDAMRQRTALDAAMQALATGGSPSDAAQAARAAVAHLPAPAAQPVGIRCRVCGSVPAVPLTIYEHNGYLILMTFRNLKGPFCRDCGLYVWRRMTDATLLRGWLGMFSFFIAPVTALVNVVNLHRITSLPPPVPGTGLRPPADPGSNMLHRPGVYVYAAVIVVVILILVVPLIAASR
jgi:hypothetical protein